MSSPRLWASVTVASGNPHGPRGCWAFINKFISDLWCHNWEDNFLFFEGSPHTHENSSRELEQLTQTHSHTWRRDSNKATRPVSYAPARSSPCGRASPAGPGQEPAADAAHGHTGHCTRNHPVSCPVQQDHRPRVTSVPRTDAAMKTPASGPEW